MNINRWWGYLHVSGSISVKRYFDAEQISEAKNSPFVEKVIEPFEAKNREEALIIVENKLNI